jgi:NaMN:DMB phosphoribosyltransferase
MVGAYMEAARQGVPVIVDGFISGAVHTRVSLVASHQDATRIIAL